MIMFWLHVIMVVCILSIIILQSYINDSYDEIIRRLKKRLKKQYEVNRAEVLDLLERNYELYTENKELKKR